MNTIAEVIERLDGKYVGVTFKFFEDGTEIGGCSVSRLEYLSIRDPYLCNFRIYHDYCNQGFGTKALTDVVKFLESKFPNRPPVCLATERENKPACKVYEKCGFVLMERSPNDMGIGYQYRRD